MVNVLVFKILHIKMLKVSFIKLGPVSLFDFSIESK